MKISIVASDSDRYASIRGVAHDLRTQLRREFIESEGRHFRYFRLALAVHERFSNRFGIYHCHRKFNIDD